MSERQAIIAGSAGSEELNTDRGKGIEQQKQEFEIEKLKAEIAQITQTKNAARSLLGRTKEWSGVLISIVALLSGAFGAVKIAEEYFYQQARRLRFEVTKELIDLSRQLGSNDRVARSNAALLLSAYEEHAVPILVSALGETNRPGLPEHAIYALELILEKEHIQKNKRLVFEPLLRQASLVFQELVKASKPELRAVNNYVDAIEHLAKGSKDPNVEKTLEGFRKLLTSQGSNIADEQKERIIKKIKTAKTATMR